MHGLMMNGPLMISSLIRHADRCHGDTEIVSRTIEGPIHRYTYRDAHARARRLANALGAARRRAGRPRRHAGVERLSPLRAVLRGVGHGRGHPHRSTRGSSTTSSTYIVNHAEDRVVFFDLTFLPLVEKLAPRCPRVKTWVAMTDRAHMPAVAIAGPAVLRGAARGRETTTSTGPSSTRTPPSACATRRAPPAIPRACCSATARRCCMRYAICLPDAKGYSARSVGAADRADVPRQRLGHSRTRRRWSAPSSCFPGAGLDGASLYELFESEGVDCSAGVPTVWLGLINYMKQNKLRFSTLKRTTIGGVGVPAGDDPHAARRVRRQRRARLGHDRDEPGRHDQHARRRKHAALSTDGARSRCR